MMCLKAWPKHMVLHSGNVKSLHEMPPKRLWHLNKIRCFLPLLRAPLCKWQPLSCLNFPAHALKSYASTVVNFWPCKTLLNCPKLRLVDYFGLFSPCKCQNINEIQHWSPKQVPGYKLKPYRKLRASICGFLGEIWGYFSAQICLNSSLSLKGEAEVHRLSRKITEREPFHLDDLGALKTGGKFDRSLFSSRESGGRENWSN